MAMHVTDYDYHDQLAGAFVFLVPAQNGKQCF